MRVHLYYPFRVEFDQDQLKDFKEVIAEYIKFKDHILKYLKSKGFQSSEEYSTLSNVFNIFEGKIEEDFVSILIGKRFPLFFFTFCFDISDTSELDQKVNSIRISAHVHFVDVLNSFFRSRDHMEEIKIWNQLRLLKWEQESKYYFLFEIHGEKDEEQVNDISQNVLKGSLGCEYCKSHWYYGELFELFCSKAFAVLFYRIPEDPSRGKFIHVTRDSVRDIFLLSEILLNSLQNVASNTIKSLYSTYDRKRLMDWMVLFADLTEPIRVLISNRELMSEPGENTFGICSKLAALDRALDSAKLMISLRSELTNEYLQSTIKQYTRKLIILTVVMLILTAVTVFSYTDSLVSNVERIVLWIQDLLAKFVLL